MKLKSIFKPNFLLKHFSYNINIKVPTTSQKDSIKQITDKEYDNYSKENQLNIKKEPKIKKFDNRTIGQKYINEKNKPIIPINSPLDIINQKTNLIYKYDTIQILEALKHIELKEENIPKINFIINIIRKKNDLKHYESPEMLRAVYYIQENINTLPLSYKISFFYNLAKLNYFNNDKHLVFSLLENIISQVQNESIEIRHISNLVYAISLFNKRDPKDFNFDDTLFALEEIIIKNIFKVKSEYLANYLDSQSFSNIILAYSKTQTGSEEFYRILSDLAQLITINKPQEIATIVYSYSNNVNCNDKMLFNLLPNVLVCLSKSNPNELVNILRAYHRKGLLDELPEIEKGVISNFYIKQKAANPLDVAYVYNILAPKYYIIKESQESIKFFELMHSLIKSLSFAFEGHELSILMERSMILSEYNYNLYNQLCNQLRYLLKKNKMKGKELDIIHFNIKDIKANNSEYNQIKEDIENYLRKIKYYF